MRSNSSFFDIYMRFSFIEHFRLAYRTQWVAHKRSSFHHVSPNSIFFRRGDEIQNVSTELIVKTESRGTGVWGIWPKSCFEKKQKKKYHTS